MMDEKQLVDLFTKLGAREPEQWAHSQASEGINQIARFIFLRQAWNLVVPDKDQAWIKQQVSVAANAPGSAAGPALERLLASGASEQDLTTVVRTMQWQLLFRFCYLLDDPGVLEAEVRDVAWKLFQVNDRDEPLAVIAGLHESVLETEPNGSEMRL